MSWQATAWAAKQPTGSPARKLLLLALANYADADGICWPSQDVLSTDTEQSVDTVQRQLKRLAADGYITISVRDKGRGRWSGRTYTLNMSVAEMSKPQIAARSEADHAAPERPTMPHSCAVSPCRTAMRHEQTVEHPIEHPTACAREADGKLDQLIDQWPTSNVQSRRAVERAWQDVSEADRQQLLACAPLYLADCKRERRKVCDLKTFIVDRRDERYADHAKSSAASIVVPPHSPEWDAWRRYRQAQGESVAFMDAQAGRGVGWSVPSLHPPSCEPSSPSPATSPLDRTEAGGGQKVSGKGVRPGGLDPARFSGIGNFDV